MAVMDHFQKLKVEHREMLNLLSGYPDYKRIAAENRFFLIKEYEEFCKREAERLGKRFRKVQALKDFCNQNQKNWKTFYGYMRQFKEDGIEALVPAAGHRAGKSKYLDVLPFFSEVIRPGKKYIDAFKELIAICEREEIDAPSYHTFWRLAIKNGFSNKVSKNKNIQPATPVEKLERKEEIDEEDHKRFGFDTPDWIRIVDKKAFNIAFYKYSLVVPFLNPALSGDEKKRLINDIVNRVHEPFREVQIKISKPSLYRYITIAKKEGFDGLIDKHCMQRTRRYKNIIHTNLTIDIKNPLGCFRQLKEIIEKCPATNQSAKEVSLTLLNYCLALSDKKVCKYKPIFLDRPLTDEKIQELETYKAGVHKNHRIRAIAILMANDNRTILEIMMATGRSMPTIYSWLKQFRDKGIDFIKIKRDKARNNDELKARKNRVIKILHQPPKDYGINRTAWILDDLAKVYNKQYGKKISGMTIYRTIKSANYSWRRAKRVLTSNDPEYREKIKKVRDTIQNLGPNDAFFFIDEAGPWQVKKYGGKSYTEKGTIKTFPQFQKPKGRVTFIGALDAVKNQITWLFTKNKNTDAVVCLIKILYFKYHKYSMLNLTWDCASWHKSKELQKYLDELNNREDGPIINVVPLPKRAQYLNIIESIFSAMKRAVIFNSNYGSEYEMKVAISKYFQARNKKYKDNPKRAGNKIWGKEYYNLDDFESGLHKRM